MPTLRDLIIPHKQTQFEQYQSIINRFTLVVFVVLVAITSGEIDFAPKILFYVQNPSEQSFIQIAPSLLQYLFFSVTTTSVYLVLLTSKKIYTTIQNLDSRRRSILYRELATLVLCLTQFNHSHNTIICRRKLCKWNPKFAPYSRHHRRPTHSCNRFPWSTSI